MGWMHDMGWWGMGWMWIFWIAALIVVILLIRWVVMTTTPGNRQDESPEDILKKRYARGEIDHDEYQRMLKELRQ